MTFFNTHSVEFQILACVAAAMLLGAIIGLEREFKDKPAGLRTHILVAGAAALLVSVGNVVTSQFQMDLGGQSALPSCPATLTGYRRIGERLQKD